MNVVHRVHGHCTGIVAQIKVIVFGKQLADAMQDGETAVAAVEDANRPGLT